jgi:NAD+ synthase (glutamine-hydrolysing)
MSGLRVTLAQLNPTIGDIKGNLGKMVSAIEESNTYGPDLVVFSELCVTGYPPRDLLERTWFIDKVLEAIDELAEVSKHYPDLGLVLGAPQPTGKEVGRGLYNSAILLQGGMIEHVQHKSLLPDYDVFDEVRYFDVAPSIDTVMFKGERLGISVCEDAWTDPVLWPERRYPFDPQRALVSAGATFLVNISASPFHVGKEEVRYRIFQRHSRKYTVPFVFVNQVGGNDELLFDGRSMCLDYHGNPLAVLPSFEEQVVTLYIAEGMRTERYQPQDRMASVHAALVMGLRDYAYKCGFQKAVIGVSGGIDSAVVTALAQEALGSENVLGVTMPGPYSSKGSVDDSRRLAANLGIRLLEIPITPICDSYFRELHEPLDLEGEMGVTLENIQARVRGNILMALSNQYGHLVLSTGNKSELAVGYCTLYGDMTGGLAVISDVPKTMVYQLARHINSKKELIPVQTIDKPPSAELRPNQKDTDSLPSYDVLDPILHYYVDEEFSPKAIQKLGFDRSIVEWTVRAVDKNEYKRRQSAPGLKVTPKAFGMGRRMPIAARYREPS